VLLTIGMAAKAAIPIDNLVTMTKSSDREMVGAFDLYG
jgi:hypothetical protein